MKEPVINFAWLHNERKHDRIIQRSNIDELTYAFLRSIPGKIEYDDRTSDHEHPRKIDFDPQTISTIATLIVPVTTLVKAIYDSLKETPKRIKMEFDGKKIEIDGLDLDTKKIEEKFLALLDSEKTLITSFAVEEESERIKEKE